MKKTAEGQLVYSPSDLVRYLASPFASWMDRYYLENPGAIAPDEAKEDQRLIAETGQAHERSVLADLKAAPAGVVEILTNNSATAREDTLSAIKSKSPVIYQAALHSGRFAGYADFLMLDAAERYQVWDTKLARSPKPYYAVQLCCYADMLADMVDGQVSDRFGIILGSKERSNSASKTSFTTIGTSSSPSSPCRTGSRADSRIGQIRCHERIITSGPRTPRSSSRNTITSCRWPASRSARSRSSIRRAS